MESALHRIRRLGGNNLLLPSDIQTLDAGVARALALISDGLPHTGPEITKFTGMDSGRRRMREVRKALKPYGFRLPCWRANKDSMVFIYQLMPDLTGRELGMKIKELADAVLELTQAAEKVHQSLTTFQNAVAKASTTATELRDKCGDIEVPTVATQPAVAPQPAVAQPAVAPQPTGDQAFAAAQPVPAQPTGDQAFAAAQPVPPQPVTVQPTGDQAFASFSSQLRDLMQDVPPGSLNIAIAAVIERYAPGAAAPGQGGIRQIPPAQYANFIDEIRALVAQKKGQMQ